MDNSTRKNNFFRLSVISLDAVVLLCFVFSKQAFFILSILSPFCFMQVLGLKCGLCGGTRCLKRLFSGDICGAFSYNLIVPIYILVFLFVIIVLNMKYIFNSKIGNRLFSSIICARGFWIALTAVFFSYFIFRNIF